MHSHDLTIPLDDTLLDTLEPLTVVATGLYDEPGYGLILDDVPYFVAAQTGTVTRLTWAHFPWLWKVRPCPEADVETLLDRIGLWAAREN